MSQSTAPRTRRGQRVLERLEARDLAVRELPDLGHTLAGLTAVQANRQPPEHHDRVAAVDPLLRHELERLVGGWDLREDISADGLSIAVNGHQSASGAQSNVIHDNPRLSALCQNPRIAAKKGRRFESG